MNKTKLRKILTAISPKEVNFSGIDSEITKLKEKLKETVVVKTLEDVNIALERNRKRLNFEPLTAAFDELKKDFKTQNQELEALLNSKQTELGELVKESSNSNKQQIDELAAEIAVLQARKIEIPDFTSQIQAAELRVIKMINLLEIPKDNSEEIKKQFKELEEAIRKLRLELQQKGGGSMNRQIRVEGVDVLTKYTDINIYGVTSSVITSVDDTNKRVNIGIQGGGGGSSSTITLQTNSVDNGSQTLLNLKQGTNITVADDGVGGVTISASAGSVVAGITRVASVISVSSTLAAAALTDYVMFANVGINVTLPSAISNTNLYTVKNMSVSSVLVSTTAGQTIDGSASALMPVQNQTLGFISNNSVWGVV